MLGELQRNVYYQLRYVYHLQPSNVLTKTAIRRDVSAAATNTTTTKVAKTAVYAIYESIPTVRKSVLSIESTRKPEGCYGIDKERRNTVAVKLNRNPPENTS